jgi:hypothetical protein
MLVVQAKFRLDPGAKCHVLILEFLCQALYFAWAGYQSHNLSLFGDVRLRAPPFGDAVDQTLFSKTGVC